MVRWVFAVALFVCLMSGSNGRAASIEHESAIDGAAAANHYAVISPTYLGNGSGPQSYIRLFNGKLTASSTFTVTLVGVSSGRTYGNSFTLAVPHMASIQLSIQELQTVAGAGSLTGGDTTLSVYIQNSDPEAGYQHAVYDWTTNLFENMSICHSLIDEQMLALHNQVVLANVHTSKAGGGNFPSTIIVHNYGSTAATYNLDFYNAGSRTNSGATIALSSNSGKYTCGRDLGPIAANASMSTTMATVEADTECTLDSDETYFNVVVSNKSGAPPNAVVAHNVRVAQYGGNSNFGEMCAVNKVANAQVSSTTKFQGEIAGTSSQSGTFAVTVTGSAATGTLILSTGATSTLTGTYTSATNALNVSGGGFTFTGAVAGNTYIGGYSGPSGAVGGFAAYNSTLSAVTAYCGTFQFPGGGPSGPFNLAVAANGTLTGIVYAEDGALLSGTGTATSVSGTTASQATFTGTIAGQSVSGTVIAPEAGTGSFSGTACTVP